MKIISHRGLWSSKPYQNTIQAFQQSFNNGFGIETDIRDFNGELVISHDVADEKSTSLEKFFELYNSINNSLTLALNIKSDGLQNKLEHLISKYAIENYFVFDMSIPDHKQYINKKLLTYLRLSDYESDLSLYDYSFGIWLDAFDKIWYDKDLISKHTSLNKQVCIVSEELHRRDHNHHWNFLLKEKIHLLDNVILCTDFPELAKNFFNNER
jgi:glycerophosphoryl diester phosphodiesterase